MTSGFGLENLKQLILDKIKEEALIGYEEDTDESKILGKIWNYTTKNIKLPSGKN